MVSDVPTSLSGQYVFEVKNAVLKNVEHFATVNYIYILDSEKRLEGVLSVRELFRAEEKKKISEIMTGNPVVLHPHSDQERAVVLALRRNIKAVPVVNQDKKFLGVIPSDVILHILHSEHAEDLLHAAGVQKSFEELSSLDKENISALFKRRIPWLLLGLGAGFLAALIIQFFRPVLEAEIFLAAFIPAIVYLSDAVGNQTQVLFIRNLTFQELFKLKFYVWREFRIGMLLALTLGSAFALLGGLVSQSFTIALILAITLLFSVLVAMITAIAIPLLLLRFKQDPAIASGPFSTAVRDISSLIVYFSVASLMFRLLS